jgi:hypothetical protein
LYAKVLDLLHPVLIAKQEKHFLTLCQHMMVFNCPEVFELRLTFGLTSVKD